MIARLPGLSRLWLGYTSRKERSRKTQQDLGRKILSNYLVASRINIDPTLSDGKDQGLSSGGNLNKDLCNTRRHEDK